MNTFLMHLSPENWLLLIAFFVTAIYSNWLIGEAEKQKQNNRG